MCRCPSPSPRAALLALSLLLPSSALAAGDVPPRVLWNPPHPFPTALSGAARTAVTIRVPVDPQGRPGDVQIVEISPPGAQDEAVRAYVSERVRGWRFAPARKGGTAVAATYEQKLLLGAVSPPAVIVDGGWGPRMVTLDGSSITAPGHAALTDEVRLPAFEAPGTGVDPEQKRRRFVLSLPVEERLRMLQREAAQADALLAPGYVQATEAGIHVLTDLPGEAAATIARNIAAGQYFAFQLFPGLEPLPVRGELHVVVYRTRDQYLRLQQEIGGPGWSGGFYSPCGLLVFHAESVTIGHLLATMLHEGTHALLDRHVGRSGFMFPRWFDEGFAEYIGGSDIRKGKIVAGQHRKKTETRVVGDGAYIVVPTSSKDAKDTIRKALREKTAIPFAELLATGPETFYGNRHSLYYAQSYLAVHFLRHGQPGWEDDQFRRFVLYLSEGYPAARVFREVYGMEPEKFQAAYEAHLKSF